jgi:hypothetical protein
MARSAEEIIQEWNEYEREEHKRNQQAYDDEASGLVTRSTADRHNSGLGWLGIDQEARNMDRDSITKDHAKTINASVQPSLGYLYRLRERMVKTGFPPGDPLLKLMDQAYDSMHRLFIELHYLSCDGVGGLVERGERRRRLT